jgi:hypothetical protein
MMGMAEDRAAMTGPTGKRLRQAFPTAPTHANHLNTTETR